MPYLMQRALLSRTKVDRICPSTEADRRLTTCLPAVIAQMFEWNWDSVAVECTDFLGPAGYGYVQGEHLRSMDLLACPVLTIPQ